MGQDVGFDQGSREYLALVGRGVVSHGLVRFHRRLTTQSRVAVALVAVVIV